MTNQKSIRDILNAYYDCRVQTYFIFVNSNGVFCAWTEPNCWQKVTVL